MELVVEAEWKPGHCIAGQRAVTVSFLMYAGDLLLCASDIRTHSL